MRSITCHLHSEDQEAGFSLTATPIYQSTRLHIPEHCRLDYTCYGHTGDKILKGEAVIDLKIYTLLQTGKNMKKGVLNNFYSRQ